MPIVRLKGINTVTKTLAGGTKVRYHYHRASGRRLSGAPNSPEFIEDFAEAEKSVRDRSSGTFSWLARRYSGSPEFAKLADSTQQSYTRMLSKAESEFGTMPLAALDDPQVRQVFLQWRADVASMSGPREADHRLSVVSAALTWARDYGMISHNHVAGFRRLHHVDRSEKIWTDKEINAFMAVAPIEMQQALILALHTGQRQGDLLRLSWTNYDGVSISIRQGKTGQHVSIPCTVRLRAMLDAMERKATVILATKTGQAFKPRYFKHVWAKTAREAGVEQLHFNDLRGTAITLLAEAGCSIPQIASISGHSLKTVTEILERYLARTSTLSAEAINRFENATSTSFANQLQTKPVPIVDTTSKSLK